VRNNEVVVRQAGKSKHTQVKEIEKEITAEGKVARALKKPGFLEDPF
jgi:hypothetical protein